MGNTQTPTSKTRVSAAGQAAAGATPAPYADKDVRVRGCCASLEPGAVPAPELRRLARELGVLAHPIRLRLLAALAANPGRVCVCDLEAIVPVKQPTVSHHLRVLRQAGLVDSERDGLWAYYRLKREAVRTLAGRIGSALAVVSGDDAAGCGIQGLVDVAEEERGEAS